jgi:hypothetical protein
MSDEADTMGFSIVTYFCPWLAASKEFRCWPVATDIAAQANFGFRVNSEVPGAREKRRG